MTIPIVKHSWLVQDAGADPAGAQGRLPRCRTGRCGPVLVDIPRDVQEAEVEFRLPGRARLPGWRPPRPACLARQVDAAAAPALAAERPVLYVGGGVLNAERLRRAARAGRDRRAPVVTTLMAKGRFPETHALFFGWPGMHGPKWSNWAMNKCDLLLAAGARFDDRVTGLLSAFAPGATVVHLDIDSAEIGKLRSADVPVVGPLSRGARGLAAAAAREGAARARSRWLAPARGVAREFPLRYSRTRASCSSRRRARDAARLTAAATTSCGRPGVGQHQMWAMQYLVCDRPRTFITSGGLGTMGYGLPAAVGAKAARPDATVVCIDGDGCFQMTCQELATAVLEDLPIVVVIVNNGYLGMVQQWQDMFFDERLSHVHLPTRCPTTPCSRRPTAPPASPSPRRTSSSPCSPRRSRWAARRWSTAASTRASSASR